MANRRRIYRPSYRQIVRRRANDSCEKCGIKIRRKKNRSHIGSFHHRFAKRLGGKNSVTNLVYVCLLCHRAIERDLPSAAAEGWVAWTPRPYTPLRLPGRGWVLLVPDGTTEPLDEPEALRLLAWENGLQPA